jgi:tRNA dimethylallyltransferase
MPILCALVGATGVGKTELAIMLAKHFNAEIISLDSRQIYKGFCIGTAQPSEEYRQQVIHHFVNFLSPTERYSAGRFCKEAKALVETHPEKTYILVGGTGLYLQSLIGGLPELPVISESIRSALLIRLKNEGLVTLYEEACATDPAAMSNIPANDVQRILRTLEICMQTGKKYSEIRQHRVGGLGSIKTFWLNRPRDNLYAAIDARVVNMVAAGWITEVENLLKMVPGNAPAWQSLGYREWADHLCGKKDFTEVLHFVQQETRRFAKRQLTWFRHQTEATQVNMDGFMPVVLEEILTQLS